MTQRALNRNALSDLTDYLASGRRIKPKGVSKKTMDALVNIEELFYRASLPCPHTPINQNLKVPEVFRSKITHKVESRGNDVFLGEVSNAVHFMSSWGGKLKLNARIVK